MSHDEWSPFARTVMMERYAWQGETWKDVAKRVAANVMAAVPASPELKREVEQAIFERKLMPGGRYLYASGRDFHQVQNCLLLRAEDSREGWADLLSKVTMALMTGAGIGVVYSDLREEGALIRRTGGYSSGPLALMQAVNEVGRSAKQGGNRRAAIWAGLHWNHPDVMRFIKLKNWSDIVKQGKENDWNFPAPMDHTNISVILDDAFFDAYEKGDSRAQEVYWTVIAQACMTGEPGFSVDTGENNGENLRNAPVHGNTRILTDTGYRTVDEIKNKLTTVWTGKQWVPNVEFKCTATNTETVNVTMTGGRSITCDPSHPFLVEKWTGAGTRRKLQKIDRVPANQLKSGDILHVSLPASEIEFEGDSYTLGYLYGDGHFRNDSTAEVTFCVPEKLALLPRLTGVRSVGNDGRGYQRAYVTGDFAALSKEHVPSSIMNSSISARASFVAGVFDADGNYDSKQKRVRLASVHRSFLRDVALVLESLGILAHVSNGGPSGYGGRDCSQLVIASQYNQRFGEIIPTGRVRFLDIDYAPYRASNVKVISVTPYENADVYCADVGVEEHSFQAEGVIISNCTEVTSRDDSDICNLASINLARVESHAEMRHLVDIGSAFLTAGTVYSDVPYEKVAKVREKNRRLGLGLMGVHEFLMKSGSTYGKMSTIRPFLQEYEFSHRNAQKWAGQWNLSNSVKTRAIAPTGTIGIVAETTTGIEPMFCAAYKRRYYDHGTWRHQYVVDPTAKRLIAAGVAPEALEDAYSLSRDIERRVRFQADVQKFVDHGISSTLNLPAWGSPENNSETVKPFGEMLMHYLPRLRGITVYPDGARGGQPLTPCDVQEALSLEGQVLTEQMDVCDLTRGGSCGS